MNNSAVLTIAQRRFDSLTPEDVLGEEEIARCHCGGEILFRKGKPWKCAECGRAQNESMNNE